MALDLLSSMATREILAALCDTHRVRTGASVALRSMGGVEAARRLRAGERTDVVVLAASAMVQLEAEGLLQPDSCVAVARSGIAAAVPAGAARPPFHDEASVRAAVRAAGRVAISTGPSGEYLTTLFARWESAPAMMSRLVEAPPGVPVATLLAQGDADLGFQQASELQGAPGIDILGPMPPSIQVHTIFTAGVTRTAPSSDAAASLVAFLASAEAAETIRRYGMEPARA